MVSIKKYKFYILITLILAGVGYFIFGSSDNTATTAFKCPADYTDKEIYNSDLRAFIAEYTEKNPNTTEQDLITERNRLFIENNCVARYYENKETYSDWCPKSEQEIGATLEYMRSLETEEGLSIMSLLSNRKCDTARQRIIMKMAVLSV